jgi:hypothetical protein
MRTALAAAALLALVAVPGPGRAADDRKKDETGPLPGKATWDVRAFAVSFRVVETRYDPDRRQVTWVLETREGKRTGDFQREVDREKPYVFKFLDADMDELAAVRIGTEQFRGIPRDRVMPRGTRLEVVLDVPDVMDRTKKVVLQRGSAD